jgi:patatin-like phospholipase/acyl hydrolase
MSDVEIGTSAAPTYFPPYRLDDLELIDGGVVTNNPAALAMSEARKLWPHQRRDISKRFEILPVTEGRRSH